MTTTAELPTGWREERIGEVYRFTRRPKGLRYSEYATIPFIPMNLIPDGGRSMPAFIEKSPAEIASGTYFEKGDVLLAKITPSFENGKQAIASNLPGSFGIATTEVIPIQARAGVSDARFLFYYLLKADVRKGIASMMEGSTGRQRVPEHVVRDWVMPLPSLPEQTRIAGILETVQRAIAAEDAMIRIARDLKKSLLRHLFTHGLRGEALKETEIGPVPESWEVVRIGDVGKVASGGTPDRANAAYWQGGTIPWVKTGEVDYRVIRETSERITELGLRDSAARLYPVGTLLVAMYGQGITRGKVGLLGIEASTNQACAAIVLKDEVVAQYLYQYLTFAYERLRNLAHGANQQNLNALLIREFAVPMPGKDEQREIAYIVQVVTRKVAVHEARQRSLQYLFKTLLNQLMKGQ